MRRAWIAVLLLAASGVARADLRASPGWLDPTWHYRVPVSLPSTSAVGSTNVVDVDFAALLTQLGITGTFDTNSWRLTRSDGTTLASIQQWTDAVYAGATDGTGNSRGELRFLAQDGGAQTYWLYFDITANGAKAANPQTPINGGFEVGGSGTATPAGWALATTAGFDAQIRPTETPSITTDGTTVGNGTPPITTDGTPLTGGFSYLMGARSANEPGTTTFPAVTLTKTITVPASNSGNLVVRYRIEGWDSGSNGSTQFDYLRIAIVNGATTTELVGPTAGNYTTLPYSANLGTQQAANNRSGYGQYNGWDTATNGAHQSGMTAARGSQPWWTLTASLAGYAGQTITLRISSSHTNAYRSWISLDDVEWSRQTATITNANAQAFGVNITAPNDTASTTPSQYQVAQTLSIRAQVQATTSAVRADVVNPSGTVVATGVILYDDGTHGDTAAGDRIFTNNGSVAANPTYTFGAADAQSASWLVRVFARDSSTSSIGATAGHVHIPGAANTPQDQAHFWNIDDQLFGLVKVNLVMLKTSSTFSDPVNGTTNPKSIPGALKTYTITVTNQGAGASDANTIRLSDAIPTQGEMVVANIGGAGSGPVLFTQGSPTSGLTYTFTSLASNTDSLEFSNDGGTTWTYTPTANANGTDTAVTHFRIAPTGSFAANAGTAPSFSIQFRMRVK